MKKVFKQELFNKNTLKEKIAMGVLLAGVAASTAVTGHFFKKELANTRENLRIRAYGGEYNYYLFQYHDLVKAKQQLDAIPDQIAAIEQGITE